MEIGEKFLPIGTVVLLKGGKKELMIMGYCIIPGEEAYDKKGKVDVSNRVFDYGGCVYPEGMITSNQLFAFDHSQIERVSFLGYQTDSQKELSKILNGARDEIEKMQIKQEKEQEKAAKEETKKED